MYKLLSGSRLKRPPGGGGGVRPAVILDGVEAIDAASSCVYSIRKIRTARINLIRGKLSTARKKEGAL